MQDDRAHSENEEKGEFLLLAAAHLITLSFFSPGNPPISPCPAPPSLPVPFNCLLVSVGGLCIPIP